MRKFKRQPLDPKDARGAKVDNAGTLWVDGTPKGIKSTPATNAYREGWDRTFGNRRTQDDRR